jgi:hypothetical protein
MGDYLNFVTNKTTIIKSCMNTIMQKIAEDAFKDELEKIALNFKPIKNMGKGLYRSVKPIAIEGWKGLKKSFSNLGSAGSDVKKAYAAASQDRTSSPHIQDALINLSRSKAALSSIYLGAHYGNKLIKKIRNSRQQNYEQPSEVYFQ